MFILCLKSSHEMGMGHVFRMVNLRRALRDRGCDAVVVMLETYRPAMEWLERAGVAPVLVSTEASGQPGWEDELALRFGATVWVNDRLDTDADHATKIKELGLHLVTFDDFGGGAAHSDVNIAALADIRGEVPQGSRVLVGLKYLVLDLEIAKHRRKRTESNSWVVSLGGTDTYGMSVVVTRWLSRRRQAATLILGPGFDHVAELEKEMPDEFVIKRSVPSLAVEFAEHDLAITGGGITAFEAAAAGLPTITFASEKWEVSHCLYLQEIGCSIFGGEHSDMQANILSEPLDIESMSVAALRSVDVKGADRVCNTLLELLH
jgi:spore coat polysaccharide biosynthesis predicted glycosyltransferase SpsG